MRGLLWMWMSGGLLCGLMGEIEIILKLLKKINLKEYANELIICATKK